MFRYKNIAEDYILDEMNKIKLERSVDNEKLSVLENAKQKDLELDKAEIRLEAFQQLIHKNLDQFTIADKRAVLGALETRIAVTNGDIEIKGVIPQNLITIA